jgi:transposase
MVLEVPEATLLEYGKVMEERFGVSLCYSRWSQIFKQLDFNKTKVCMFWNKA